MKRPAVITGRLSLWPLVLACIQVELIKSVWAAVVAVVRYLSK